MASKSKTTQSAQTNQTPWNAEQLKGLYDTAQASYGKTQATAGQQYGQAAQSAAQGAQAVQPGVDAAVQLGTDQLSGKYLDAASNPYLAGAIKAAIDPLQYALLNETLPAITDQSIAQGAYGGTRNSVANGIALRDFNQQAGDISAKMAGENYANERAIQQTSPALLALAGLPAQMQATGAEYAATGANAGLAQLMAALGVGPNAINSTSSGTSKTSSTDPLGWFKALTAPTGG